MFVTYPILLAGSDKPQVGDAFVLCDAGGGTVDLTAYEIMSLRPFKLAELTTCNGKIMLIVSKSY